MRKKLFYHGSPVKGIKILKPKLDPRLGIKGIFVADEPFTPMLFSLLPNRAKSMVNSVTKNGKFIKGEFISPLPLNETGYLYVVKPNKEVDFDKLNVPFIRFFYLNQTTSQIKKFDFSLVFIYFCKKNFL